MHRGEDPAGDAAVGDQRGLSLPNSLWAGSPADSGPTGRGRTGLRLAERLGSVNAAAATLGTTWPRLCKAFTRHSLGMPARNP
jgi:hypothetical protein